MKYKAAVISCFLMLIMILFWRIAAHDAPGKSQSETQIKIIAAENNYGSIAKMIGGDAVSVTSIMNNPNQDPHLFSVNVATHRLLSALSAHDIVIVNGGGYDPWAINLIKNTPAQIINVAGLNHVPNGANPHFWYDLAMMQNLARQLAWQLSIDQPSKKILFTDNLRIFLQRSNEIEQSMQVLRKKFQGVDITATEPVANYLTGALGLNMRHLHFQLSVMNDTEPSAQDRADFLRDLALHKVELLIYNQQVTNPVTTEMRLAAVRADIPVLGVNELLPKESQDFLLTYQSTLNQMQHALR
jgi:zinc/manganese transport system substrate-binding protein